MPIYKLFSGAVQDAAATLDFREDGTITAMWWNLSADLDADNESASMEVSFGSTSSMSSNDTTAAILQERLLMGLLTSGAAQNVGRGSVSGISIPVGAGERIFLHTAASGPASVGATVFLHVEGGSDRKPPTRRR